jgi:uncharacterized protein with ParB-like and HNH nuclease domain
MTSRPISLHQLFMNRLFRIPDYQRGYAWKHEHLSDFWDDLINLQDNHVHYTGLLSLRNISQKSMNSTMQDKWLIDSGFTYSQVIDGQQRLTSISIFIFTLLKIIRELDENKGKNENDILIIHERLKDIQKKYIVQTQPPHDIVSTYMLSYETDNPSENYLIHKIFEAHKGGTLTETYYTKNLDYAKEFFESKLIDLYNNHGKATLERLYKKVTQQLMFNIYEIDEDYDVFVAFETMNNRGKKLTNLELLKNRLIYLTTLFKDEDCSESIKVTLRKNTNETWKEIYFQLGRNAQESLNDNDFLRAHWYIYFHYSRKRGDDYFKFLMNHFSYKNIYESISESDSDFEEIGDELSDEVEETESVTYDGKLKPNEIDKYVTSLKSMAQYWYYSFYPTECKEISNEVVKWVDRLNRVGIGYFRPLICVALLQNKSYTSDELIDLLKSIERFIFLFFRMARYQSSYKSSEYINYARSLYSFNSSFSEIANSINENIEREKSSIINGFITNTKRRFSTGLGFYTWSDIKYFLYEYEYHLFQKFSTSKIEWDHFTKVPKDKISIEHILPQTPTKPYWKNQFRDYRDEEIKLLSGSLGNLLPLSSAINSSLQNDGFDEKKNEAKGRRGYSNGSHSEIEVSKYNHWTAQNILERGLKLLGFLESRWGISFSEQEKFDILHIEFVNDNRPLSSEIVMDEIEILVDSKTRAVTELEKKQYEFWKGFIDYCVANNRDDRISKYAIGFHDWYNVGVGSRQFYIFFQALKNNILRVGIYIYGDENFKDLRRYKEDLSNLLSFELMWDKSRKGSNDKRVFYEIESNVFDQSNHTDHYKWMIDHYDELMKALRSLNLIGMEE